MKKMSKTILAFMLGIFVSFAMNVAAETVISSGTVSYSNTTVNAALDELFSAVDINNKIGTTDISSIGNGTITGAIKTMNNQLQDSGWIAVNDAISYRKKNGFVTIHAISINDIGIVGETYTTVGTLPAEIRPSTDIPIVASAIGGTSEITGYIKPSGVVSIYAITSTGHWGFTATYPL